MVKVPHNVLLCETDLEAVAPDFGLADCLEIFFFDGIDFHSALIKGLIPLQKINQRNRF